MMIVQKNILKDILSILEQPAQDLLDKEWNGYTIKVDPKTLTATVHTPDGREDFYITATSAERKYEVIYQSMKEDA